MDVQGYTARLCLNNTQIIFKLDKNGWGQQLLFEHLQRNSEEDLDLRDFTKETFRRMCIIAGCDYLEGIPGLGLKTAQQFVQKHKDIEAVCCIASMPTYKGRC